jgi:TonB family protein
MKVDVMDLLTLMNLIAWSVQIALLTVVAAILLRVLRVDAPGIRYAWWRGLLALCLVLPMVQPWQTAAALQIVQSIDADLAVRASDSVTRRGVGTPPSWVAQFLRSVSAHWVWWTGLVLFAGAAARVAWIAVGLLQLRRLRRTGEPAAPGGGHELAALIEAGAEIRYVSALGQPVTFGLLKPVVLLPGSLAGMTPAVQRAVLAHELWHVRRSDWIWVLIEECIRAAFWFNPAMWWLVSRVQCSREEVVDELTVQVTNARRSYLEALLAFAEQPAQFPAAPFVRRRELFRRMVLISREAVMSSRRIVTSSAILLAVVLVTSWYAATTFPLSASAASVDTAVQAPPRDRRPGEAGPETARERELKKAIEATPSNVNLYIDLAKLEEQRGARTEAEATLNALRQVAPNDPTPLRMLAGFYNRTGQFSEAIAALEDAAALDPTNPQGQQVIATFYFEKASKDPSVTPAEKQTYIRSGIAATDRALAYDPDFAEAMVYKNLFLRMQANMETDTGRQKSLIAEADALRSRAMELQKLKTTSNRGVPGGIPGGVPGPKSSRADDMPAPPPPPPPPPPPGLDYGTAPVRVGGNIKPPAKVRDVKPVYPEDAKAAGVQGVVIMEVLITTSGQVGTARVLKGVPMLDQAALDAVHQWEFQPTLLNGAPVPVIMTVTVNFTLQ